MGATNIGYIKERKQFTTQKKRFPQKQRVLQIQDISKNESNSQLYIHYDRAANRCYKYRIYQRTKAIHNWPMILKTIRSVLQIQDISKNESNSQPLRDFAFSRVRCYKYRIYQRTKAIHNRQIETEFTAKGATNIGYIKERKQFTTLI